MLLDSAQSLSGEVVLAADLRRELPGAGDRTIAIVLAATLDDMLRELIASFLINDKDVVSELLGTGERLGPISHFATRAKTAYCLGLVTKKQFLDLKRIARIRNKFAHGVKHHTFEDEEIRCECKKLLVVRSHYGLGFPAKHLFVLELMMLMVEFTLQAMRLREGQHKCRMFPYWPGITKEDAAFYEDFWAKVWQMSIRAMYPEQDEGAREGSRKERSGSSDLGSEKQS